MGSASLSPTESAYIENRVRACVAQLGGTRATHHAYCDCTRKPLHCSECDDSFEDADSVQFDVARQAFICLDCADMFAALAVSGEREVA